MYTEDVWDLCVQYVGAEDGKNDNIVGKNSIIRSCIVYNLHQMLFGWLNEGY
jgi:hypothetical protein